MQPEFIGKYRIEATLGQGAMGVVYRGVDEAIGRTVAIKTIHPHLLGDELGQTLKERFQTEATAAGKCIHNNIVTIFEYGQHEGTPFIAMEFVEGRELWEVLRKKKRLPLKTINHIIGQVIRGLHYAHELGIVHRDIKPENIIVLKSGTVKVADFGIAKLDTSDMTQIGDVLGTPSYMSPEQAAGANIDRRSDIFSVGVVLFEMLTYCGDCPDSSRTHKVKEILNLPPSRKLDYTQRFPPSIASFFDKCLAYDPAQRLDGAKAFVDAYRLALKNIKLQEAPEDDTVVNPDATVANPDTTVVNPDAMVVNPDATVVNPDVTAVNPDTLGPQAVSQKEAEWIENRLGAIGSTLTQYLGPMSDTLVKKLFEEHQNVKDVIESVAKEIPDERERKEFLNRWTSDSSLSRTHPDDDNGTPKESGFQPDPDELNHIEQHFAFYVGPMASHLIVTKIGEVDNLRDLVQLLADEIPDQNEPNEFLEKVKGSV